MLRLRSAASAAARSFSTLSPLEPLAGVPASTGSARPRTVSPVTKLANGVRVVSIDNEDTAVAVSVFSTAGTRDESGASLGTTHALTRLVFGGTATSSRVTVTRRLEQCTAKYAATHGRDFFRLSAETARPHVGRVLAAFADMLHPRMQQWEIDAEKHALADEQSGAYADRALLVNDWVHRTAFRDESLGNSLYASPWAIEALDETRMHAAAARVFAPANLVLVASGLPHTEFVEAATQAFGSHSPSSSAAAGGAGASTPAAYFGGEARLPGAGGTRFALFYQGVGWKDSDLAAAFVLHALLGHSSGGPYRTPGSGVTSPLQAAVDASASAGVTSLQSSFRCYGETGLFGIVGETATAGHGRALADVVGAQAAKVAAGKFAAADVKRAVVSAQAAWWRRSESRDKAVAFAARQTIHAGAPLATENFAAALGKVTADDLARVAKRIFGGAGKPTQVTAGDVVGVPPPR